MLYKQAVEPATLERLKILMDDQELVKFTLVGGTALALHIGHRLSIDIDLFTTDFFEANKLAKYLEQTYKMTIDFIGTNTIKGSIAGVKVDLLTHKYLAVKPSLVIDNIRIASMEDIAAMKLNAITENDTRIKDFVDIAYLSSYHSLQTMLKAYEYKYSTRNPLMPLKGLAYHNDIIFDEPIILITKDSLHWPTIENRLHEMIKEPNKIFQPLKKVEKKEKRKKGL